MIKGKIVHIPSSEPLWAQHWAHHFKDGICSLAYLEPMP